MAIRDLFRACPLCGGNVESGDRCAECGTRYRRARGDRIEARPPGGAAQTRPAVEWLDALGRIEAEATTPVSDRVIVRVAGPHQEPVRYAGEVIGFVEQFGPRQPGSATLTDAALRLETGDGGRVDLPIDELSAIQPTSNSLQLRMRDGRLFSLRFPDTSLVRWESLLQTAVRRRWTELSRGAVTEFLPRIGCR